MKTTDRQNKQRQPWDGDKQAEAQPCENTGEYYIR